MTITDDEFLSMIGWMPYEHATEWIEKHPVADAKWCSYCCGYRKPHEHAQESWKKLNLYAKDKP